MRADDYPMRCTGCDRYVYEDADSPPCPNCFPGLAMTRREAEDAGLSEEKIAEEFGQVAARRRAPAADDPDESRGTEGAAGTRTSGRAA